MERRSDWMWKVKDSIFFVTGTDTGVGKTVLTSLLTRHLRLGGVSVAALKPLCSGDRADALALQAAQENSLTLNEINPWHFRAALSPLLAARIQKRKVILAEVLSYVRKIQTQFPCVVVEGAGGLLSPLGEDFDSRDLIVRLNAIPVVVSTDRLGVINQVRLVLAALPTRYSKRAQIVLMSQKQANSISSTNRELLRELLGYQRVHSFPWVRSQTACPKAVEAALKALVKNAFPVVRAGRR